MKISVKEDPKTQNVQVSLDLSREEYAILNDGKRKKMVRDTTLVSEKLLNLSKMALHFE